MNLKDLIFGGGVKSGGDGGTYRDSIQAWLPIKNIIGGVVITKDGRFVKILELLPVNIYLKSPNDRQNIISSFAAYLKIAPNDLQMVARTLPADTQAYVEQMQRYAEKEDNEACREMIEDNIQEIGNGIASDAMRHRFFLVFQYEASMRAKRNTVDSIIQRLNEEADTARRYGQPEVIHPIDGSTIMEPQNCGDFSRLLPKEEKVLELVQQKVADGGRVLIYTSWTRTDSQKKLIKLLRENGYCTELLTPRVPTEKREEWVDKQVKKGLQVLIANPRCLETGLDLNAFATVIYYSMSYNLFTLRQASRRSWRINQTATKVEVYMLYYANTMQAKTMKLMASKLAVAGIIEGTFSEEGLAAMSDVRDMTSQMAKELAAGIRDNVEDIAAAFKKMAIINPNRKKSVQEETDVEGLPALEIVPEPHESSVRTAQAAAIWERYEGLLARTNEEKKKRKSKVAEADENQLSIFDFAA